MTSTAIVPSVTGVEAFRASTDAAGLCRDIVVATAKPIQGRKFVCVEGWQAIAIAHGCVASAENVERTDTGFKAIGKVVRMDNGTTIATAEGFVGDDEKTWFNRPEYAKRAMAQTRAISRACRSAFAHVVVMMNAGLSTTPAEEMQDVEVVPAKREPKKLNDRELARALIEFSNHGIDEQKLRAHLGKDKPWTKDELNDAWNALIEKHEPQTTEDV